MCGDLGQEWKLDATTSASRSALQDRVARMQKDGILGASWLKAGGDAMDSSRHLYIVWASNDPITSMYMVFAYASNSIRNGWWDKVFVVVWGSSQVLLCEDEQVRRGMKKARSVGVGFSASLSCAESLGTVERLLGMDLDVIHWGAKLSELLQSDAHVIVV